MAFSNVVNFMFIFVFVYINYVEAVFLPCKEESLYLCKCEDRYKIYVVDCSNTNFRNVPKGVPTNATHLLLDNNNITVIQDGIFLNLGLTKLKVLSINQNRLNRINKYALKGLPNLRELYLYENVLHNTSSLPEHVFLPLSSSLEVLDIRKNLLGDINFLSYPLSVAELYNLKELRMDGLRNISLPTEFKQLKNLQTINFAGGRQNLVYVKDSMFQSVSESNISEINLSGLHIGKIDNKTFSSLHKLRTLDLSHNPKLQRNVGNIALSLRSTQIENFILNNTGISYFPHSEIAIINTFCGLNLKKLFLDDNSLNTLNIDWRSCLPNLEILSLADNFIPLDISLAYNLLMLKNLVGYNISCQFCVSSTLNIEIESNATTLRQNNHSNGICGRGMACPVVLPKHLEWLDVSQTDLSFHVWPEMVFLTNSTLNFVNASSCGIQTVKLPIYCVWNTIPRVETFDISNNALQCINATTFDGKITHCNWSSLKYVYMGYNKLGQIKGNICNKDKNNTFGFLKPLTNLRILDLSHNMIESENALTSLQNLTQLQTLDLSSNALHNFPLNLSGILNLSQLNLAGNNLQCLSKQTIFQLNKLQRFKSRKHPLSVDLSNNLLSCKCECIHFFKWMIVTETILKNKESYRCQFDDGKIVSLEKLSFVVHKLHYKCYGTLWLKMYISLEFLLYLIIIISCILYRKRHALKYFCLKARMNRNKLAHILNPHGEKYPYSAFISCHHTDAKYFVYRMLLPELETEETKLKFCIAQRNFRVGVSIMDNIMRAMNRSKRVIFIISKHFLTSKWCQEEILIAHQLSLERGDNTIICVLMPNIIQDKFPATLKMVIKTVTCLKWPLELEAQKVFWLKLQDGLEEGYVDDPKEVF